MAATYDLTTDVGKIRLNTFGDDTDNAIFSDEEIGALITQEGHIKLAAARLYLIVAGKEAYIQKVITNMGLTTNGAALAAEFRQLAKTLKDEVREEQALTDLANDDPGFDVIEMAVDGATTVEILWNNRLRLQ